MEQVFRGPRASVRDAIVALGVAVVWVLVIGDGDPFDIGVGVVFVLSPIVAGLFVQVGVGPTELRSRGVVRRRRIALDDIRQVGCEDDLVVELTVSTPSGEREIRLPAVADAAGLELLLRSRSSRLRSGPPPAGSPSPVIHQGGLVRRWSGRDTYVF